MGTHNALAGLLSRNGIGTALGKRKRTATCRNGRSQGLCEGGERCSGWGAPRELARALAQGVAQHCELGCQGGGRDACHPSRQWCTEESFCDGSVPSKSEQA